ncbi:MAG: DegT/DnrJ/EryC1/StrS family aminotransferase, partial [Flavobacteriaceae bacterium]|nr:DegT/DnrJ/EryC1/StrS family aminotransferase [Flavobacteriaceae bacterium]
TQYRDKLQKFLLDKGVETLIHYPISPHQQKAYKELNIRELKIAEQLQNEVLSLPISSVLALEEMNIIVNTINGF